MTNFEKIKRLSKEEFIEWFFHEKEDKTIELIWCKDQYCEDIDGNCKVCFAKWLNKEVEE